MNYSSSTKQSTSRYSPIRRAVLISTVMLVSIYLWEIVNQERVTSPVNGEQLSGFQPGNSNVHKKKKVEKVPTPADTKLTDNSNKKIAVLNKTNDTNNQKPAKQPTTTIVVAKKIIVPREPVIAMLPDQKDLTTAIEENPAKVTGPLLIHTNRIPLPGKSPKPTPVEKTEEEIRHAQAEELIAQGREAIKKRDYATAIFRYKQAVNLGKRTASLYYALAHAYARRPDHSRTIEYASKAISLSPKHASWYITRGVSHHALHDYQKAVDDYSQAIALHNDYALAYRNRALAYRELGEKSKATNDLISAKQIETK